MKKLAKGLFCALVMAMGMGTTLAMFWVYDRWREGPLMGQTLENLEFAGAASVVLWALLFNWAIEARRRATAPHRFFESFVFLPGGQFGQDEQGLVDYRLQKLAEAVAEAVAEAATLFKGISGWFRKNNLQRAKDAFEHACWVAEECGFAVRKCYQDYLPEVC